MKEACVSARIISHSENPLQTIYAAARQCYFPGSVGDMEKASYKTMADLVQRCIRSGHTSVLEHVSFTFAISGVSRALSHQLVRHRLASYSQQSQRYVEVGEFECVCPPSIRDGEEMGREFFNEAMTLCHKAYRLLLDLVPAEDARFVLPQSVATNIVMTMNCRELLKFIEERSCRKAQWEIRRLANIIQGELVMVLPEVFGDAGPKCFRLGYCPEPKGCGAYPAKG